MMETQEHAPFPGGRRGFAMPRKLLSLALLALPCTASAEDPYQRAFAKSVLSQLQAISFETNREYCGTIGVMPDGKLVASRAHRGRRDGCRPSDPFGVERIVASYHTHAGFDEGADSELPSIADVRGDMFERLNGYLSTPGGRFWFIDGKTGTAYQVCGVGCLPSDPRFVPGIWGPIRTRYTLKELERRQAGF